MESEKIFGAIYPLPKSLVRRFTEGGKTVFIKFGKAVRLREGMRLVLYESGSDGQRALVGEGRIKTVVFGSKGDLVDNFGSKLLLSPSELNRYISTRPWGSGTTRSGKKIMTGVEITDYEKYLHPIRPNKPIPVSGRYMRTSDNKWLDQKRRQIEDQ